MISELVSFLLHGDWSRAWLAQSRFKRSLIERKGAFLFYIPARPYLQNNVFNESMMDYTDDIRG